jgi:hypothetical protein
MAALAKLFTQYHFYGMFYIMTTSSENGGEPAHLSEQVQVTSEKDEALTVPLRVRVSDATEIDLNRVEAYFRGMGYKNVNRSHLIRTAIKHLIQGLYDEHPEMNVPTTREEI